jgi:hypothetical protein
VGRIFNGNSRLQLVDGHMDRSAQARRGSANNLRLGLAAVRPLNAALCGGKAAARAAPIKEACTKTWPRQVFTRLNRRISIRANNAALLAGNPREE